MKNFNDLSEKQLQTLINKVKRAEACDADLDVGPDANSKIPLNVIHSNNWKMVLNFNHERVVVQGETIEKLIEKLYSMFPVWDLVIKQYYIDRENWLDVRYEA